MCVCSPPGGAAARPLAGEADLFVGNSGTTMRFLTALLCLGQGRFRLDGVPRMRERPMGDLLDALTALGVAIRSEVGRRQRLSAGAAGRGRACLAARCASRETSAANS